MKRRSYSPSRIAKAWKKKRNSKFKLRVGKTRNWITFQNKKKERYKYTVLDGRFNYKYSVINNLLRKTK